MAEVLSLEVVFSIALWVRDAPQDDSLGIPAFAYTIGSEVQTLFALSCYHSAARNSPFIGKR